MNEEVHKNLFNANNLEEIWKESEGKLINYGEGMKCICYWFFSNSILMTNSVIDFMIGQNYMVGTEQDDKGIYVSIFNGIKVITFVFKTNEMYPRLLELLSFLTTQHTFILPDFDYLSKIPILFKYASQIAETPAEIVAKLPSFKNIDYKFPQLGIFYCLTYKLVIAYNMCEKNKQFPVDPERSIRVKREKYISKPSPNPISPFIQEYKVTKDEADEILVRFFINELPEVFNNDYTLFVTIKKAAFFWSSLQGFRRVCDNQTKLEIFGESLLQTYSDLAPYAERVRHIVSIFFKDRDSNSLISSPALKRDVCLSNSIKLKET